MKFDAQNLDKLKVTIMGLGLHGGGLQSALFFARAGAAVTVTDLRDEKVLRPSIEKLAGLPVTFVLGHHREEDFRDVDVVIKNPGVPPHSSYLQLARFSGVAIESDLSVFLSLCDNPLIAVTGSKGKSTIASAIHFVLDQVVPGSRLGGNITVSPLSFLDELDAGAPVVLELSSWQLADLGDKGLLRPWVSVITNILPDHQNAYSSMDSYIADKKLIFRDQEEGDFSLFNYDDPVLLEAAAESPARVWFFSASPLPERLEGGWLDKSGAWWRDGDAVVRLFGPDLAIPGRHNRLNLLTAALALRAYGIPADDIATHLPRFGGIPHRLEMFLEKAGLKVYNDSAATIPQATVEAVCSLPGPLYLICGGTDKNIDFAPLAEVASVPRKTYLLSGSGTDKIIKLFTARNIPYAGPFTELRQAVHRALEDARTTGGSLLFSPGCASFGMFLNEFDRGKQFKSCIRALMD